MKKINKIFITLASIVSISSLPIVAAACDEINQQLGENKKTDAELKPGTKSEEGAEPKTGPKSEEGAEPKTGTKSEEGAEPKTGTKSEEGAEPKTGPKSEEGTEPKTGTKSEEGAGPKTRTKSKEGAEPKPGTKSEEGAESKTGTKSKEGDKKYNFPELKDFLDKKDNKLFEIDNKNEQPKEFESISEKHVIIIENGNVKIGTSKNKSKKSVLKLNSKFGEWKRVNTHGSGSKSNIGHKWKGSKKGIKISKNGDGKIVLEWQLYYLKNDGKTTLDYKIYKQEIDLKLEQKN
ncbi:variable surface lipoprotein [Mycoplasmopsis bovis]|uniref:variable surface lipoprotein n=1 Tax=Mycoplasmopsis bovis TaxID=28903 RepID=UPI00279C4F77